MSSCIPALGPICLLKGLRIRLETERSTATMCRDCGEMNVCPNGGLVAHGEPLVQDGLQQAHAANIPVWAGIPTSTRGARHMLSEVY